MAQTRETSERISALGGAIGTVSSVLDGLLAEGVLTTNFMEAHRSPDTCKYVPAYLFRFVREAGTCERFEDLSRDHSRFIDLMIAHVERHVHDADTSPLSDLKGRLTRDPRESSEYRAETRALHMSRMLHIGWSLLAETAEAGLWERDPDLAAESLSTISDCGPPLRYGTREDVVRHAVDLLRSKSLAREASAAEAFLHFNPVIHG